MVCGVINMVICVAILMVGVWVVCDAVTKWLFEVARGFGA